MVVAKKLSYHLPNLLLQELLDNTAIKRGEQRDNKKTPAVTIVAEVWGVGGWLHEHKIFTRYRYTSSFISRWNDNKHYYFGEIKNLFFRSLLT